MNSTSTSRKRKNVINSDDEDEYSPNIPTAGSDLVLKTAGKNQFPHSREAHNLVTAAQSIQEQLTTWFGGVHDARNMPWRRRWDPTLTEDAKAQRAYEVWVSEVMLQQTRVETVIPYYRKWIEQFPTVEALSNSNIEAVNALWKGLGYYSRANRLLEGAKIVVQRFEGRLPDDPAILQADVPGIGRYSAGAICSIAYGKCVPVLDGNVHRLLSRILALHAPPKAKATTDLLWSGADAIVKGSDDPGAVNQGLIELGSTICTPTDPKCGGCPVRTNCGAFKMQSSLSSNRLHGKTPVVDIEDQCDICEPLPGGKPSVTMFPMKVEKKVVPKETDLVCVISWKRKGDPTTYYLLRKRPKTGLLAGLWDFPAIPNISSTTMKAQEKSARGLVAEAFPQVGGQKGDNLDIKGCDGLGSVLHVFSHVKKTFQVVSLRLESPSDVDTPPDAVPGDWMDDKQSEEQGEEEQVIEKPPKKRKVMPVQSQGDGDDSLRLKWVLEPNVAQENLGTGTMKVWALVQNPGGDEPKKTPTPKRKVKATDESQRQISSFFKPS